MTDTIVYLIRHGSTEVNENGRMQGGQDVSLSALGQQQAACIGAYLARGTHTPALYVSPMRRALETAQIIQAQTGAPIETLAELAERDYGAFDGLTFAEVAARRDALGVPSIDPTHDWHGVEGVEDDAAIWGRVRPHFEALLARHAGGAFGVVTHSGVIQALLYHIFEIPPQRKLAFKIARGMFAEFAYQHGYLELRGYYPDPCHWKAD